MNNGRLFPIQPGMNREVEFRACEQETKEEKKAGQNGHAAAGASATIDKKATIMHAHPNLLAPQGAQTG